MTMEILTGILVLVTAIYAYLTLRMAKASEASVEDVRQQSEAMLRPYISISPFIRPQALILYLKIANTGRTAAQNLRLTLDRDFFRWGEANKPDRNLKNLNTFSLPIDSLPPGSELLIALGQGWSRKDQSGWLRGFARRLLSTTTSGYIHRKMRGRPPRGRIQRE